MSYTPHWALAVGLCLSHVLVRVQARRRRRTARLTTDAGPEICDGIDRSGAAGGPSPCMSMPDPDGGV